MIAASVPSELTIVGRSSSHFTRVTRIFAHELDIAHGFRVVPDLTSLYAADYAGNPALRLPILETPHGAWFGALNICRELARRGHPGRKLVWPEDLQQPLLANAQELTSEAMASEVSLIMTGLDGQAAQPRTLKLRRSLEDTLSWLEQNLPALLTALPVQRDLSYLEVTLFCLVSHLPFRGVLSTEVYPNLGAFCAQFASRPAAAATDYRFDV